MAGLEMSYCFVNEKLEPELSQYISIVQDLEWSKSIRNNDSSIVTREDAEGYVHDRMKD